MGTPKAWFLLHGSHMGVRCGAPGDLWGASGRSRYAPRGPREAPETLPGGPGSLPGRSESRPGRPGSSDRRARAPWRRLFTPSVWTAVSERRPERFPVDTRVVGVTSDMRFDMVFTVPNACRTFFAGMLVRPRKRPKTERFGVPNRPQFEMKSDVERRSASGRRSQNARGSMTIIFGQFERRRANAARKPLLDDDGRG